MSDKYLLPCSCGKSVPVERRQAGTTVTCTCGNPLEVPTIRGLTHLPRAEEIDEILPPIWSLRHGLVFLGLVIAVPAFVFAGYVYARMPSLTEHYVGIEKAFDQISPAQSWMLWTAYAEGMPKTPTPDSLAIKLGFQWLWQKINIALVIGGIGVLLAASALLVRGKPAAPSKRTR